MKYKKPIITVIILLAVGGAAYAYWRFGGETKEPTFLTAQVTKANIRQVVSSTGTLQAVTTVLVGS